MCRSTRSCSSVERSLAGIFMIASMSMPTKLNGGWGITSGADGLGLFSFETELSVLFSLLAELVVLTLTLTSPVGLLVPLFAAILIPMPVIRMSTTAPPAHMSGILYSDIWLRDGRDGMDGKRLDASSSVMFVRMNSV